MDAPPKDRSIDEDNFFPEKYARGCIKCKNQKQACSAPPWSGLPCSKCTRTACEWEAPADIRSEVTKAKKALDTWRKHGAIKVVKRPGNKKKSTNDSDESEAEYSDEQEYRTKSKRSSRKDVEPEFRTGLRELGAGRHREQAKPGPSRLDRDKEETSNMKSKTFDFFDGDKFARPSKRSRPDDAPSKRPEREREAKRNAQARRNSSGSSDLSEPSSSQEVRATKTPRKEILAEPSSSKRRSSPPSAGLPKARELDRTVSGTSTTHTPVPLKKKRVVQSDSEDDYQEPEPSRKRVDDENKDKDVRKEKKPRLSFGEGDDTPRKDTRREDGRPKPKQRRDLAEREVARTDRGGDVDSKKIRRDEVVDVDKMDRGEREVPKKVRRDERDDSTRVRRDERDESERRPRDDRDRDRFKKDRRDDRDDHKKTKRDDKDDEAADPAHKKRRLSDDVKPVDEPSQQKNKQHSAIAQRALDPKRAKPDTPARGGEPSPVARKPARGFGTTSGKSTPAGKHSGSSGDKVMDLLSASLAGASPAYASSLGVTSSLGRDRYSSRADRTPAKPVAPVVQVTRGTLNLMGTIKSISDFQTAAKRRYAHSYGLQPVGTAKSTQTTAFMNRFREQRAHGAYHNSLSNLLTTPDTSLLHKEAASPSEVQQWLQVHGTAPLAPLKTSAPVVRITPAEPIESASTEALQGGPSEPTTNRSIVL